MMNAKTICLTMVLLLTVGYAVADPIVVTYPIYLFGQGYGHPVYASTPSDQPVLAIQKGYESDPTSLVLLFNSQDRNKTAVTACGITGRTNIPFLNQKVETLCIDDVFKPAAIGIVRMDVTGAGRGLGMTTMTGGGSDFAIWESPLYANVYGTPTFLARPYPNTVGLRYGNCALQNPTGIYRQTDYPSTLYAHSSFLTIKDIGCNLICCCNVLRVYGIIVDPPALNSWLKSQRDGYAGLRVNGDAVARYAATRGVPLVFKGKGNQIPLKEGLLRGLYPFNSVHNEGHFVLVNRYVMITATNPDPGLPPPPAVIKHGILDPNKVRDNKYLEDYTGIGGTRTFYPRAPNANSSATASLISQSESASTPSIGGGSIVAYGSSGVTKITLLQNSQTLAMSDTPDFLENATTGELVNCGGIELEFSGLSAEDTTLDLEVEGTPLGQYTISVFMYDTDGNLINPATSNGSFNQQGQASLSLNASGALQYSTLQGLDLAQKSVGSKVAVSSGNGNPIAAVTMVSNGCFAQPPSGYVPAVCLSGASSLNLAIGQGITSIVGVVQANGTRKTIQVESLTTIGGAGSYKVKPIGVPIEKLSTTGSLYSRVVGRVTAIYYSAFILNGKYQINNCLDASSRVAVGQSIAVNVVQNYNEGIYMPSQSDLQILP